MIYRKEDTKKATYTENLTNTKCDTQKSNNLEMWNIANVRHRKCARMKILHTENVTSMWYTYYMPIYLISHDIGR